MYIDFQYFYTNEKIIIKELAIFDENSKFSHYIFLPPTAFSLLNDKEKKKIKWLENNHHNLKWNDGYIHYKYLPNILKRELNSKLSEKIYVKGLQKKKFLEQYGIKSTNLEDLGIKFKIKDISGHLSCRRHQNGICALRNVFFFKYFVDNLSLLK